MTKCKDTVNIWAEEWAYSGERFQVLAEPHAEDAIRWDRLAYSVPFLIQFDTLHGWIAYAAMACRIEVQQRRDVMTTNGVVLWTPSDTLSVVASLNNLRVNGGLTTPLMWQRFGVALMCTRLGYADWASLVKVQMTPKGDPSFAVSPTVVYGALLNSRHQTLQFEVMPNQRMVEYLADQFGKMVEFIHQRRETLQDRQRYVALQHNTKTQGVF
jgi:hypothetical protein